MMMTYIWIESYHTDVLADIMMMVNIPYYFQPLLMTLKPSTVFMRSWQNCVCVMSSVRKLLNWMVWQYYFHHSTDMQVTRYRIWSGKSKCYMHRQNISTSHALHSSGASFCVLQILSQLEGDESFVQFLLLLSLLCYCKLKVWSVKSIYTVCPWNSSVHKKLWNLM